MTRFTVVLTRDEDGGFDASIPAPPGCHTWGRTRKEAMKNAAEAVGSYVGSLIREGDPIPEEVGSDIVEIR